MNTDLADLKDLIYIKLHGLNIRINNGLKFSNPNIKDLQVVLMENKTDNEYAKGLRLRFSLKDFEFIKVENMNNCIKPRNEVTLWFDMDNAKHLKDFLNKVII